MVENMMEVIHQTNEERDKILPWTDYPVEQTHRNKFNIRLRGG